MIHPDHFLALHVDRRRSLEAAAREAALVSMARRNSRKPRRFAPRRIWKARRSAASAGPAPSG